VEPGSLYWPTRAVTAPFRRGWFAVELEGAENIPGDGALVLAANHLSFLDSFLMMGSVRRKVLFLGKAEYMKSPTTRFFKAAGMIPVDRSGKGIVTTLTRAAEVLHAGGAIGVFPEGTRSRDGRVHRGHTGAAHLALRTHAALVPVGVLGTDVVQPPGARFPKRNGVITFRFGAPLDTAGYHGSSGRRTLTDRLMDTIAALAERPYVDTVAPVATPLADHPAT
jgi:1-acyl-sn-glycerol-3-phosphate acyltransferase